MATARCGLCLSGCRVRRCAWGGGLRLLRALPFSLPRSVLRLGDGHCLLRALPFRLPHSVLRLGRRKLRAARLGPFLCGLGVVCAFVRFPIAVFQYAASGLLVLDRYFWFFDAGFRFSTTDFELSTTDFNFRLQSY